MITIAHLGPSGTYTEQAALAYANWVQQETGQEAILSPCSSIAQTLKAVAQGKAEQAVVPVENSIEGTVAVTLDLLWQLDMNSNNPQQDSPLVLVVDDDSKMRMQLRQVM